MASESGVDAGPSTAADAVAALEALYADDWAFVLDDSPEFATWLGDHTRDARLDDRSQESFTRRITHVDAMLARLADIEAAPGFHRADMPPSAKLTARLFRDTLETYRGGARARAWLMPLSSLEGPQIDFAQVLDWMPKKTRQDFDNILARMRAFPAQLKQNIELLGIGVAEGRVVPTPSIRGVESQLRGHIDKAPRDSVFFAPFAKLIEGGPDAVEGFTAEEIEAIAAEAEAAVRDGIQASLRELLDFFLETYQPAAASRGDKIGCHDLPDGPAAYAQCLRFHLSTDMSAEEVHAVGLAEVDRIRAAMRAVAEEAGVEIGEGEDAGKAMAARLRADPEQVWESAEALLDGYRALCAKIEAQLPSLFGKMPRTPYEVVPTPAHQAPSAPAAYYYAGVPDGSRPGRFYANTHDLSSRPKYEMEALALHESIPGHHMQISLANEAEGVPPFRANLEDRRYFEAPSRRPLYTSFIEGWGLYSESLGEEMEGIYTTPSARFGRLSMEMFRACRLVVDTGLHAKGWSVEQAREFCRANTALSDANIAAEIDRYVTWPGQACAYKVGEIKIRLERQRAAEELGGKFSLRDWHDMVLALGNVPLVVLEEATTAFIAQHSR